MKKGPIWSKLFGLWTNKWSARIEQALVIVWDIHEKLWYNSDFTLTIIQKQLGKDYIETHGLVKPWSY